MLTAPERTAASAVVAYEESRGSTKYKQNSDNIKDITFSIKWNKANAMSIRYACLHVIMSLVVLVVS